MGDSEEFLEEWCIIGWTGALEWEDPGSEAVLLEELKFDGVWTLPKIPISSDEKNKI